MRLAQILVWLLTISLGVGLGFVGDPPVKDVPVKADPAPVTADVEVTEVKPDVPAVWKEVTATVGQLKKLTSNVAGDWMLIDDATASLTVADDGKSASFAATTNGRYRIVVFSQRGVKAGRVVVVVGDGVDPNPPGPVPVPPGPAPKPQPTPALPVYKFVVVEDTAKAGQWRGDILGSPAVAGFVKDRGLMWRVLDIQAAEGADDEAKAFFAAAKGKELPWVWAFDKSGQQVASQKCPTDPAEFVVAVGGEKPHKRAMGNNPPDPERKKKSAFKNFGDAPAVPLIDRKNWKTVDLGAFLPPVYDQDGIGQCNASATAAGVEACRNQAGLKPVHLSAGDLYSNINGGVDQGSLLEDGLVWTTENGIATAASVPYVWNGRVSRTDAVKSERAKYRVLEAYRCPDFDAVASALQQGFFIIEGVKWYDSYFTPDRDGWLPAPRGNWGGHALLGYGLTQRNGQWGVLTRNSWNTTWGVNGNCVIPESAFGGEIGGFWAIRSTVQTESQFPVTPRASLDRVDPFRSLAGGLLFGDPKLLAP